jgi:hypothetical protein
MPQYKSINPSYIYYALGILAQQFNNFKTACNAYDKLANLIYPNEWSEKIDIEILNIRSKQYVDKDTELPICYNCNHNNPLLTSSGDQCNSCAAPFKRCSISFEILPLVEFKPAKGITDDQAIDFIKMSSMEKIKKNMIQKNKETGVHSLKLDTGGKVGNLFENKLNEFTQNLESTEEYKVIELDESVLKTLNENEVYIIDLRNINKTYPVKFYKNRRKDVGVIMCKFCFRFFKVEEFENAFLKCGKCCPLCKNVDEGMKGGS